MSDPITCPQCKGRTWEALGPLQIECDFCHGRGIVGGPDDPEENPPPPPTEPPPAWRDRIWRDPFIAKTFSCRVCLDSRRITHLDRAMGTLVSVPCQCAV